MAEAENEKQSGVLGLIVWALVGMVSAATGFAAPMIYLSMSSPKVEKPESPPTFVPFGETVANLDEGRLTRFLKISTTLEIDKDDEDEFVKQLEKKRTIRCFWNF